MKLLVCLGNPGKQYEGTRHNAGFLFADYLINKHSFSKVGKKFKGIVYEGRIQDHKVMILKPETFMNVSGEAVQPMASFYKLSSTDVWVAYDDFDIDYGTTRYRERGGAGTHNGMKSVISSLGTQDFPRLRIGVGPLPENWNVSDFVLSRFSNDELTGLTAVFSELEDRLISHF